MRGCLYVNISAVPFHIRNLTIHRLQYPWGVLEPIPYQYWGQLYSYLKNSIITLGTNQENLIFICQFKMQATLFYLSSILS